MKTMEAAQAMPDDAPRSREELLAGLGDGRWRVRRDCVWGLHDDISPEVAQAIRPLLHDPRAAVRAAAVGVWARRGAEFDDPAHRAETVQVLLEIVEHDDSIKVRRQAVLQLAWSFAHPDLEGAFQSLLDRETDPTLHRWAGVGLLRSRAARGEGAADDR